MHAMRSSHEWAPSERTSSADSGRSSLGQWLCYSVYTQLIHYKVKLIIIRTAELRRQVPGFTGSSRLWFFTYGSG